MQKFKSKLNLVRTECTGMPSLKLDSLTKFVRNCKADGWENYSKSDCSGGEGYFCFTYLSAEGSCNGVVCDAHAQCVQPLDGPPNCECVEGWTGDGQTCSGKIYISCSCMKIYNITYADRG